MQVLDRVSMVLRQKGNAVISIRSYASVYSAIELMAEKQVGALLVPTGVLHAPRCGAKACTRPADPSTLVRNIGSSVRLTHHVLCRASPKIDFQSKGSANCLAEPV